MATVWAALLTEAAIAVVVAALLARWVQADARRRHRRCDRDQAEAADHDSAREENRSNERDHSVPV